MFGSHKVKIEGELLEKVKQCSEVAGYESVDEFVIHMLEKEIKKIMPSDEPNTGRGIRQQATDIKYRAARLTKFNEKEEEITWAL